MKPSTFFAIFLPILASVVSTLFILITRKRRPNPKTIKIAYAFVAVGVLILITILIEWFM